MPKLKGFDTPFVYNCKCCGREVDINYISPAEKLLGLMYHNKECYNCTYWQYLEKNRPDNSKIISNKLIIAEYTETNPFATILKKHSYIWLKDNSVVKVNRITDFGTIPERFRDKFPIEGVFVNYDEYKILKNNPDHQCMKKGCFDRYYCRFYFPELAEPEGAWNEIPNNYQPGWEGCPLFINKEKFKI